MSRQAVISPSVAPVHKEPEFSSEMISQALMWEKVKIQETYENWHQIKMEDGYDGWIHSFYLHYSEPLAVEYTFVTDRYVPIYYEKDNESSIASLLSYGTYVPIADEIGDLLKIYLPDGNTGYMVSQKQVEERSRKVIIELAKSLLAVPYLWGGKSSFGYDCTGFVQMVLKTAGMYIQRDTSLQIKNKTLEKIQIDDAEPGDLLFFLENNRTNHVAFLIGEGKIIHCSGQVKVESIIEGEPGFSTQLNQYEKIVMSIDKLILN